MRFSVIVLTRNEAANVRECVESLLEQDVAGLEVIVVDAASEDGTQAIVEALARRDPARVVPVLETRLLTIGEARNIGAARARGEIIAYVSADAVAARGWGSNMIAALAHADIVYGRQEHAPTELTIIAVERGMRYHHFDLGLEPSAYASNVNAAMRREVHERVPFVTDEAASALDDVLFARDARALGYRIGYEPRAIVRHKDAATLASEWKKHRREGYGWGILSRRVGLHRTALAWGGALTLALAASLVTPWALIAAAAVLVAPAVRRALASRKKYPLTKLAGATLVSPLLDLAFLIHYARGLTRRRSAPHVPGVQTP